MRASIVSDSVFKLKLLMSSSRTESQHVRIVLFHPCVTTTGTCVCVYYYCSVFQDELSYIKNVLTLWFDLV